MSLTQEQIEKIVDLAKSYGANRLILFGSVLDESRDAQDIDIACEGVDGWSLYSLAAKIEEELHMPLDIVPLTPSSRFTRYIESRGKVIL